MIRLGRTASVLAAVFICSAAAAYIYSADDGSCENKSVPTERGMSEKNEDVSTSLSGGLGKDALFSYEIYSADAESTDIITGSCPYELIGKNLSDVKEYYPDWHVIRFSPTEVVLRKNIGIANDDRYIVGIYDNYVAVFYENSEEGVYLMTEIPVAGLESDKQKMLQDGIYVEGKDRLNRILEDYSS